jgi:hypothetical protein
MRMFWQKATASALPMAMATLLMKERGMSAEQTGALRIVEKSGTYAGRSVTYFRVFNPGSAQLAGLTVRSFADLDGLTELHTGHTERDGAIVLSQRSTHD